MNLYIISVLDEMVKRNVVRFSTLHFVQTAVIAGDQSQISLQLNRLADFYFVFLEKLNLMPSGASKKDYFIDLDSYPNDKAMSQSVNEVLQYIDQNELLEKGVLPIHLRYTDDNNIYLLAGLARVENRKKGFLHLIELSMPKCQLQNIPYKVTYVKEILELYREEGKPKLRDLVRKNGYDYGQFQKDCKILFCDTFYAFHLKLKILDATDGIIYTRSILKEIAYEYKFIDYSNMHRTFVRHELKLKSIPRLGYL